MDDAKMRKLNGVIEHYKRHISRATESNDNEKVRNHKKRAPALAGVLASMAVCFHQKKNPQLGAIIDRLFDQ